MKRILPLTVGILATCLFGGASARDLDGRYADSPLREWFDHLASGNGLCCSMADGEIVADPDWESKGITASVLKTNGSTFRIIR